MTTNHENEMHVPRMAEPGDSSRPLTATALASLRSALEAMDANQRERAPFVAEWWTVEAVLAAARAVVGVPASAENTPETGYGHGV